MIVAGRECDDFSPASITTDGEAASPGPRTRRPGPRSLEAVTRRFAQHSRCSNKQFQRDEGCAGTDVGLSVWQCNINGRKSRHDELAAQVCLETQKPSLIGLNETRLDASTKDIVLEGFSMIIRHGRNAHGGGVIVLHAQH